MHIHSFVDLPYSVPVAYSGSRTVGYPEFLDCMLHRPAAYGAQLNSADPATPPDLYLNDNIQ